MPHANYLGDLRSELHARLDQQRRLMAQGHWPDSDWRAFQEGVLMAQYEVHGLLEQASGADPASVLFSIGFMVREAGERATRDAERAARDVGGGGEVDREFHSGRASEYRFVMTLMQEQAEAFGIPLEEVALDGLDPDRDIG